MIKNFAQTDESIAGDHAYITFAQWEAYLPQYDRTTGMTDDRETDKLWRKVKFVKVESVVARSSRIHNWTPPIKKRYRRVMDRRREGWDRIEAEFAITFVTQSVDMIRFY